MLDESVTDFRNLIEEKLKAKQDALGQTEAHLKKFSIIRELNNRGGGRGGGSVRGRLGPPPRNSNSNRQPLGSRLGPRLSNVQDEDDLEMEQVGVMSRVVVEKKSRDDALAEEGQKMDKKEKQVINLRKISSMSDSGISRKCHYKIHFLLFVIHVTDYLQSMFMSWILHPHCRNFY